MDRHHRQAGTAESCWLYVVARTTVADYYRSARLDMHVLDDNLPALETADTAYQDSQTVCNRLPGNFRPFIGIRCGRSNSMENLCVRWRLSKAYRCPPSRAEPVVPEPD